MYGLSVLYTQPMVNTRLDPFTPGSAKSGDVLGQIIFIATCRTQAYGGISLWQLSFLLNVVIPFIVISPTNVYDDRVKQRGASWRIRWKF